MSAVVAGQEGGKAEREQGKAARQQGSKAERQEGTRIFPFLPSCLAALLPSCLAALLPSLAALLPSSPPARCPSPPQSHTASALERLGALEARFDRSGPEGLARALRKALARSIERNLRVRPGFSRSWVTPSLPEDAEFLFEYHVGGSRVAIHRLPAATELLYQLHPDEYSLDPEHVRLIDAAREELLAAVPGLSASFRPEQSRAYVAREGARIIPRLAQERGVPLAPGRAAQLAQARRLADVLARYTAGLGIAETLLSDSYVQDVYIDAPAHRNPVYVTIGGTPDQRARGRCRTNICLGADDAESLLSRFRTESGRPFSEARPFLETDLPGHSTRVTVIGKPLSPEGLAIALRRHSTDPWTLPRLVDAGSLTPLAAGLLSLLVDGQSTVLVAGSRGAGKTSLLGALMLEFPRSQRVLTIEDTLELPSEAMKGLGYKVQSMQVQSSLGGMGELCADDALRLSLRLGESAIVMGEVRGREARTLYEAMRAGTAGSSVLGTIHGSSARSVYERVVHDMGIPAKAFSATDIVVVAGLRRPFGSHRSLRRVVEISEVDKEEEGGFRQLMAYDEGQDCLVEAEGMRGSRRLAAIARNWNLSDGQAMQAVRLRSRVREELVAFARERNNPSVLGARWVAESNDALWAALERRRTDYATALDDWKGWFGKATAYR
ncbi:MAG: type II/IV secretion system ATPase subunit [Euryarchaeota archaeon]|nr:type II/IV secretion system ATPase subunit [Euryarchaeota archaeon]